MFKIVFTSLLTASMLTLLSCGGSQHAADEKYYLVATNVQIPYWQQAYAGLSKAAVQLQVKCEMVGPDSYDPKAERAEFQRIMGKKPTGILVSVSDPAVLKDDIDAAIAQGIPVITVDSDAPNTNRLLFVGTDNYKAGIMGAKVLLQKLQGKGNVVVFTIEGQANLKERLHGYRDALEAHPQVKITEVVDMQGKDSVAFDKTKEILAKPGKVDAFVCLEAIACPEVADVLDRQKATDKVVVAMDTDQRTLEAIQKGLISATIGQKPFTMAFTGLKLLDDLHHHPLTPLASNWLQDSFSPIPTFVDTGATQIDKSNVEQFIQQRNTATSK
ncbi:MAG: substrate-binding domain-containing protein [Bryobacteraceae bacterium]|jgi:ribose transport system substrate-binding protein